MGGAELVEAGSLLRILSWRGNLWAQAFNMLNGDLFVSLILLSSEIVGECDFYCQSETVNVRRAQFNNNFLII